MVLGESPRRALAKAASDAVLRCPETTGICENLQAYLKQQKVLRRKKLMESSLLIAATKVNFDLMPGA
jgi:alpha-D-ribose 1-methylphosphonate 5-triphosphate synthase subunit PhnG